MTTVIPTKETANAARLINEREVMRRTTLGRTLIATMASRGEFPAPIRIGIKRKAWIESEVDGWIAARIAKRDGEAA